MLTVQSDAIDDNGHKCCYKDIADEGLSHTHFNITFPIVVCSF